VLAGPAGGAPGAVLGLRPEGLAVACVDAPIAFAELQLPNRKRLPAAALLAGRPIAAGTSVHDPSTPARP
jgi:methionyl-tRNA formyltransferase